MTAPVEFSARAEAERESIGDYIAQDSPRRAASFVREFRRRRERIAEQPHANRLREEFGPGMRAAAHGAHLIPYTHRDDGSVVIERVVHGARDLGRLPDEWPRRGGGPSGPFPSPASAPTLPAMGESATDSTDPKLVAGLWRVVARHGWDGLTMRRVSDASGVPLAELRRRCPTPMHLLALHGRVTDQQVLEGTVAGTGGDTPRERLFDVLMRRIDAMQPHRRGILRLLDEALLDPFLALALASALPRSMAWTLEAARIGTNGFAGALRANGLVGVWLYTARAWSRDNTEDLGATMAALDRALDRAEQAARTVGLDPGDHAAAAGGRLDGGAAAAPT